MFERVGHVFYNAHASSPIVLGDFEAMKKWPGSPDGSDGYVKFKSGKGAIFDLQLSSPDVFVRARQAIALLAPLQRTGWTLEERFGRDVEGLQAALTGELVSVWQEDEILLPSGAVVVAIAYNATPEFGSDSSALDPRCFSKTTPMLPRVAPATPLYSQEPIGAHELAVVPLEAGSYRLRLGELEVDGARVGRCTLESITR
ncbi:MAG: hypothetical protein JNM17_15260 [Archangium sp.]|nr:hypothetical protein [Archangium sp.]